MLLLSSLAAQAPSLQCTDTTSLGSRFRGNTRDLVFMFYRVLTNGLYVCSFNLIDHLGTRSSDLDKWFRFFIMNSEKPFNSYLFFPTLDFHICRQLIQGFLTVIWMSEFSGLVTLWEWHLILWIYSFVGAWCENPRWHNLTFSNSLGNVNHLGTFGFSYCEL